MVERLTRCFGGKLVSDMRRTFAGDLYGNGDGFWPVNVAADEGCWGFRWVARHRHGASPCGC